MKHIRFLSALLTFCMVFSAIASVTASATASDASKLLTAVGTAAAASKDGEEEEEEKELTPEELRAQIKDYTKYVFNTPEEKLATMDLKLERYGYELYYEPVTGEIAFRDTRTGDVLFSNPYDVASGNTLLHKSPSENVKNQLLSQIILNYTDNDTQINMYSYVEAAKRGQISLKNVKNGIRVQYIIGRQETRKLLPRQIDKTRFEELILSKITDDYKLNKLKASYVIKDPDDPQNTEKLRKEMELLYPITKERAIYVFDEGAVEREMNLCESIIKEFCPEYTYEELAYDHDLVGYTGKLADPALFRMALEYSIDEDGLNVRLPANSITFDEGNYALNYIQILPYMGAGSSENTGYTVIPDGSGTLVRFEDILDSGASRTISGKLYGTDYAYQTISQQHTQIMRLPIFGVIENKVYVPSLMQPEEPEEPEETETPEEGATPGTTEKEEDLDPMVKKNIEALASLAVAYEEGNYAVSHGFLAIIEEGDAMATIVSDHGANILHKYNTVYTRFEPRPSDSYSLGAAISIASGTYTVVSERKYTGSYRIKYMLLTDPSVAKEAGLKKDQYYEANYVGMSQAYRDYLIEKGTIKPLENGNADIPLYIEALGVTDVQKKILSVPVTVKHAITSFENLKTMTGELNEAGIKNIVYRLNGFANGGLKASVPYKISFENVVGGNKGYSEFLSYASEKGVSVFPDFDFSYARKDALFDGFSYRADAVKTIDNRYIQKRTYSATLQNFKMTGEVCISPSVFEKIFESFKKNMEPLGIDGISVSTLGSDLNSDFDKSEPYNREDSKGFVADVLAQMKEAYGKIMVDAGNAYTLEYADHVLNVSLDSSNYTYASEAIPLFGLVYHSYVNFAGGATNMASDYRHEMLKIIENGASPYFILGYDDSERIYEYYSVSYEIWKEDLVDMYQKLNEALKNVQYSAIINHEFLIGERVPTDAEKAADAQAILDAKAAEEAAKAAKEAEEERARKFAERMGKKYVPKVEEEEEEIDPKKLTELIQLPNNLYLHVAKDYESTRYTSDNGMIVRVTYANGYSFILNYNMFEVVTEGITVPGLGFVVMKP